MNNPRLATRYAKSLVDLSSEKNQLETVYADMQFFVQLRKTNPDFVALLRSPVISSDKKDKIIQAVIAGRVSEITNLFTRLLVRKNRESNLPEIAEAFMDQYNKIKGIHKVKLVTATPVSAELQQTIVNKVKAESGVEHIELETAVDESLVGGFTLQMADTFVDASIIRDLKDIRRQFLSNEYIRQIR